MNMQHKPRFKLAVDEPIFTMGSCFAREIEQVFIRRGGFPVLLAEHGVPAEHFETWDSKTGRGGGVMAGQLSRGCFHKYTIHSMSHELRRVLKGEMHRDRGLIELAPGEWFDPHASGLRNLPFELASENRDLLEAGAATIRKASVVFFTFGLTESWNDRVSGLSMNRPPAAKHLVSAADRFEFVDYGFESLCDEIVRTVHLIRETCNPNMKFVVTVSPVPLGSTFRDLDIAVANSASKTTLRAVAEYVARKFDFVDYFPSYEMVTLSPREIAWEQDQIHVSADIVKHVTDTFIEHYYS